MILRISAGSSATWNSSSSSGPMLPSVSMVSLSQPSRPFQWSGGPGLPATGPFYSGKHKRHGMNLQVIATPDGEVLWVSGALPGSVHDKKAKWTWGVGCCGSTWAKVPYKGRNKPESQKEANRAHAKLRSPRRARERPAQDPMPLSLS
jgi:hypothetical protein